MTKDQADSFATLTGPCSSCGVKFESPVPIHLDPTIDHLMVEWPNRQPPPITCPNCGHLWPITPITCIYWHSEWIGVALGQKYYAQTILAHLADWLCQQNDEDTDDLRQVIRVFDSMSELSYVIRYPNCSVFRKDIKGLITSFWDKEVSALIELGDVALQRDAPILAYIILAGVVQENPEFFFIPAFRDAMELTANAAGDIPLGGTEGGPRALDDYQEMVAALHQHRPSPELDDYFVWHDSPLDIDTSNPLDERAGNQIIQRTPSLFDFFKIWLRILTAGAMLRSVPNQNGLLVSDRQPKESFIDQQVKANWEGLKGNERHALAQYFEEISSGVSIQKVLGLIP